MVSLCLPPIQVQLNAGQLQYIRLAQPVSGTQVVQGQIQTLATNAQQVCTRDMGLELETSSSWLASGWKAVLQQGPLSAIPQSVLLPKDSPKGNTNQRNP